MLHASVYKKKLIMFIFYSRIMLSSYLVGFWYLKIVQFTSKTLGYYIPWLMLLGIYTDSWSIHLS